jgi:hypothetical protein
MHRIVESVTTLDEHLHAVKATPEVYRPAACPHCQAGDMRHHGCYYRKADRSTVTGAQSRNPVPVLRFICRACWRTCSRLPLCIAPRRWYDWAVQQMVLLLLLAGSSVHHCCGCSGRARHTVRRWRDWLRKRSEVFAFHLRSRVAELGRCGTEHESFWRGALAHMPLAQAMALLDRDLIVP